MKKILAITGLVAVTTMLHAQGYIDFIGTAANIQTNGGLFLNNGGETSASPTGKTTASGSAGGAGAYDYVLLVSSTALTAGSTLSPTNGDWSLVTVMGGGTLIGTNWQAAGSFEGNGGSSGVQINQAVGTAISVELVGWSASLGSWSQVLADMSDGFAGNSISGYLGFTPVETLTPGSTPGGAGDPTVFTSMFANGSLVEYLVPTPEPATMALTGLGALGLLLFRRRK